MNGSTSRSPSTSPSPRDPRAVLLDRALMLVTVSVAWGAVAGAYAVTIGLLDGSLGVLGVGLGALADLAGSAVLIWRFRAERRQPLTAGRSEARAALVVAGALFTVAGLLAVDAVHALSQGTSPKASLPAMAGAAVTAAVLVPLAVAKRRTGRELDSAALGGDAALSAVGAATALLALAGLLAFRLAGWWWADRVAALVVAAVAAVEGYRLARGSR